VYAGTTTGLFRSLNAGKTWKTLTGVQVNALAFDPSKPNTVYLALEHEGVGKSSDGGEVINPANNGFVDRVISALSISGKKLVAVEPQNGETSGIFVSDDKGDSWTQIHNPKGVAGVHLSAITGVPSEDRILLAASSNQMYKSVDGGQLWKAVRIRVVTPPAPPNVTPAAKPSAGKTVRGRTPTRSRTTRPVAKPKPTVHDVTPSEIFALYAAKDAAKDVVFAATDLGLLKSDDLGEYWTQLQLPELGAVNALYMAPNSDGRLIARTSSALMSTKDFGEHWATVAFPLPTSDVNDVAIPPDPVCPILVATRLGLYSSPDGGGTWNANSAGIPASTVSTVLYQSNTTAYAVEYGQLYATSDAGKSWKEVRSSLRSVRIRRLWMPSLDGGRVFGITADLGIIVRG
jgi:photosystem II stability/assembly factor-like uncharacterized protein